MKLSFDFDGTLSRSSVQKVVKDLIKNGNEIHVVTSRFEDSNLWGNSLSITMKDNLDLFKIIDKLEIPRKNIHFMNMTPKHEFFDKNLDIVFHLDDDKYELAEIEYYSKPVIPVYCDSNYLWYNLLLKLFIDKEIKY